MKYAIIILNEYHCSHSIVISSKNELTRTSRINHGILILFNEAAQQNFSTLSIIPSTPRGNERTPYKDRLMKAVNNFIEYANQNNITLIATVTDRGDENGFFFKCKGALKHVYCILHLIENFMSFIMLRGHYKWKEDGEEMVGGKEILAAINSIVTDADIASELKSFLSPMQPSYGSIEIRYLKDFDIHKLKKIVTQLFTSISTHELFNPLKTLMNFFLALRKLCDVLYKPFSCGTRMIFLDTIEVLKGMKQKHPTKSFINTLSLTIETLLFHIAFFDRTGKLFKNLI